MHTTSNGLAQENPISKISKKRETGAQRKFLTQERICAVLDLAVQSPLCICFDLLSNTGMRISEALELRWSDVDMVHKTIRIARIFCKATDRPEDRTKSGEPRIVPINNSLQNALIQERKRGYYTGANDLLVVRSEDGTSPKHSGIRSFFDRVLEKVGLEPEGIHVIRHTFASIFMMSGGKLWDLKSILGHSSIDVTERYAHFSMDHLHEQAERVSLGSHRTRPANVVPMFGSR